MFGKLCPDCPTLDLAATPPTLDRPTLAYQGKESLAVGGPAPAQQQQQQPVPQASGTVVPQKELPGVGRNSAKAKPAEDATRKPSKIDGFLSKLTRKACTEDQSAEGDPAKNMESKLPTPEHINSFYDLVRAVKKR